MSNYQMRENRVENIVVRKVIDWKRQIFLQSLLLTILAYSHSSLAGFDRFVKDVFPSGTMSNNTAGGIVKEQAAGHLMGGSVIIKTPANPDLQLMHAQAPSCKMGGLPCGAQFELLGGSLSVLSGQELARHLKNLPANAATYAVMTYVKTVSPFIEDLMEYLDAKADEINKMSQFNCDQIQKLIDPMFPKAEAKATALRQSEMVLTGGGQDMSDIQTKSKKGGARDYSGNPQLESQLGDNYNIVWKALAKKVSVNGDGSELKELLMSISGTIIGTQDADGKRVTRHLKSLIDKELIKQFVGADGIDSKSVKLYECDKADHCLYPVVKERNISQGSFLFQRVQKLLKSIATKIEENRGQLTAEEESLVALSSMPIILKIEVDLATYSSRQDVIDNQTEFIEALCFDVVVGYLQSLLSEVQEAVGELSFAQIADGEKFRAFDEDTRETMRKLSVARAEARGRYDLIAQSKARLKQEINSFDKEFENFIGNHSRQ